MGIYHKIGQAIAVCEEMQKIIEIAKSSDMWGDLWDDFWRVANLYPFEVNYYDPDTSYEEDMISKYLALTDHCLDISKGFR